MSNSQHFIVNKANFREGKFVARALPDLADGEVLLAIDSFAFTSNNVTYAAFGEAMNYWQFFPTGENGFGQIPVWGFANVVESRSVGVAVGERFYGYFPMATHLVVCPEKSAQSGFSDSAPHRAGLAAVYNQYVRCSTDPAYVRAREAEQMLLKPLFVTSFLIDDFLADQAFFGAKRVVLSSASSKTAYGTAFMLAQRNGMQVIGLTSASNRTFVESLGCYTSVLTYDQIGTLASAAPHVYVDMSGNADVRSRLHHHLGDALKYSCAVGGTHWDAMQSGAKLPGPKPLLFFAPAQIKKRLADWGGAKLQQNTGAAWRAFLDRVTDTKAPWLTVIRAQGGAAIQATVLAMLDGGAAPHEGHILSF